MVPSWCEVRLTLAGEALLDRARPIQQARPEEIVWVPGPWRDPAMLDWKRGGRFELKIFPIPAKGFGAVGGFASAAFSTARNWHDSSHLDFPGFRDRIVQVLQTKDEGGLNLYMDGTTIEGLAPDGGPTHGFDAGERRAGR